MEPKIRRRRKLRLCAAAAVAAAAAAVGACSRPSRCASAIERHASAHARRLRRSSMESSPESAITRRTSTRTSSRRPAYGMGADSLIYEPLMDFNLAKPSGRALLLPRDRATSGATAASRSPSRSVRASSGHDGSAMTPADVAFSFNLLQKYADVNTRRSADHRHERVGQHGDGQLLRRRSTRTCRASGTSTSCPSRSGAPSAIPRRTPTRTRSAPAPTRSARSAAAGITLKANPSYWGGAPKISTVDFPVYRVQQRPCSPR